MTDRTILPSEKPELRKERDEALRKQHEAYMNRIQGAWRRVGETDDGKIIIKDIYDQCLANQPILGVMGNEINEKACTYQAMRLNFWVRLRKLLTFNILKEIEYEPDQIT